MGKKSLRIRRFLRALALSSAALVAIATAAAAIESEGELVTRDRLVGNLGVAYGDIGVYPDRATVNAFPEPTGGSTTVSIPEGAEIVESIVYWAGRGPGWTDPNIVVNGVSVDADTDYHWRGPGWDQTTYVADLDAAGVAMSTGDNTLTVTGVDQKGERFYGIGFVVVYEHPSLPEVELQMLEGNEFAFYLDTYFDDIGESAVHSSVNCTEFAPAIEDRELHGFSRIMGVDAGRSDAPPRSQRLQWWTEAGAVTTPVTDGIVGIPAVAPEGSVDNPTTPKVAPTEQWGSDTLEIAATLAAGETHHCVQLQSVDIGDGKGASLSITNQGGAAETLHRLGNLVWFDANGDGMADGNEPGIDGVTVELWRDGADAPLATTTTADDGAYLFEGLLCGSYRVVIPGGQSGWTIAGDDVDVADLVPGAVNNPNANDDSDNDNNGVESDGAVSSSVVQIGDCGEDGDFSNDASNEPTEEVDRKGGPDDDPDEVSFEDGNYDDVRSNVSIDFSFEGDVDVPVRSCVPNADGTFPDGATDENGQPCDEGNDPDNTGDDSCTPNADGTFPDGATDENGQPCDEADGDDSCTPNADGTFPDGATDENGQPCDEADGDEVCDADGNVVPRGEEGVDGNSSENCDDDVPVEVGGQVECPAGSDRAGEMVEPGESCDAAGDEVCDPDGNPVTGGQDGVDGNSADNCDTADGGDNGNDGDGTDDDQDGSSITVEVEGQVEENDDNDGAPLAVTGVTSALFVLGGLMVVVLGAWFVVAAAWFRPRNAG